MNKYLENWTKGMIYCRAVKPLILSIKKWLFLEERPQEKYVANSSMRLSPVPTTKSFFRNISRKARLFLPVLFLSLLLLPQFVQAQSTTRYFTEFICLFQKTTANGVGCSHDVQDQDVENAQDGGMLYKQPATVTDKGVKEAIFKISLFSEVEKEAGGNGRPKESAYFYSRVGDGTDTNFFVKITYTDPTTNTSVNSFKFIKYKRGKPQSRSIFRKVVNTVLNVSTFGLKDAVFDKNGILGPDYNEEANKLSFYIDGQSGYELVERQNRYVKTSLLESGAEVPFGATVTADFWYCGGQDQDQKSIDGRYAPRDGELVEYFTKDGKYKDYLDRENDPDTEHADGFKVSSNKCDGDAAYKIGKTITFKLPETKELADQASAGQLDPTITDSEYIGSVLPICSIDPFTDGSVMGCIAQILYGGIFRPVAFFAQLMGKLFDFFLGYSLSDESYRHDFVQTGWQLVRDISNIFFIIIMIWTGLMAVFNTSNVSYKKVIPTLIINALIINFSLFATRVVIDISNITARIFYNQMIVKINGQAKDDGAGGYKPISESIVSSFNPQKIFEGSVLTNDDVSSAQKNKSNVTDSTGSFNSQSDATAGAKFKRYSSEYAGYFALVTLVAIAISFGVAMMFWKTAFIFVGRVIGLYVAMIFSPFAFLSRNNVPLVSKIEGVSFSSWWKDLTQYALLAPIFVFFLYIINSFLNVEFFNKVGLDQNGQGFFGSVMYVMIPMLIIYGLVTKAVGIAKKYSGEFGDMAQKFATNTTKIVGGVALGGTALVGRTAMSGLSKGLGTWAAANKDKNIIASGANRFLQWGQKSSLDIRNTKAFNALGGLGIKTDDKFASALGLGQKDALKGNVQARKDREKRKEEKTTEKNDMSHLTTDQVKKVWAKMSDREAAARAEKAWETQKTASPQVDTLKKEFEELNKSLKTAVTAKDTTSEKTIREQMNENTKKQADIMAPLVTAMLEEKKDNAHHKTEDYTNALKKAKSDITSEYGKVESAKDLSAVMRYQYAQRMLEDSLYLSKGKKRGWQPPVGGGATSGAALYNAAAYNLGIGLATGGASVVAGGIVADYIDNQQEAAKNVYEKIIRDFKKAHDPNKNLVAKFKKKIDDIDILINSHVADELRKAGKNLEDLKDDNERDDYFNKARTEARRRADDAKYDYDDELKKFRAKEKVNRTKADDEALNKLADEHRKAKDEADALDKAKDDKDYNNRELQKEEARLAREAEGKKKKDDGGGSSKPKDEGSNKT